MSGAEPAPAAPSAAAAAAHAARRTRERLAAVAWPLASFTLFLLAWQVLVRAFGVAEYILPVPSEFLPRLSPTTG